LLLLWVSRVEASTRLPKYSREKMLDSKAKITQNQSQLRAYAPNVQFLADRCNATFGYCHRMLSVVCLFVCLSVTRLHCGQTVGWIRVPLGMEVVLGPSDIVLDGDVAPPTQRVTAALPNYFGPSLLWPNGCMDRMPLGTEVGLDPGDTVLDGDPPPPTQRGTAALPIFSVHVPKRLGSGCHLVWR